MSRRTSLVVFAALTAVTIVMAANSFIQLPWWGGTPSADARTDTPDPFASAPPHSAIDLYGVGLAKTPPMGWNGYNHWSRGVTENTARAMARALVTSGLARLGYVYVNLDGGWDLLKRSSDGSLQPDPKRFPHGIAELAAYVHSLGLKFGIYTSVGERNCAGTSAGSYGHYGQDAQAFAAWGVDYVKADWCWVPARKFPGMTHAEVSLLLAREFGDALAATGRPMVLDLNDFLDRPPLGYNRDLGNLWRTSTDIRDTYASMVFNFTRDVAYYAAAQPDRWNDPDMLEVGNGGMTETEYRTMFSLWAELSAPLICGNDLTRMSAQTLAILSNQRVIAVDQDALGNQGYPVMNRQGLWVLTKPLAGGDRSVVLFNQTSRAEKISTTVAAIGLSGSARYLLTDLWTGALTSTTGAISALVPGHSVVMVTVAPQT